MSNDKPSVDYAAAARRDDEDLDFNELEKMTIVDAPKFHPTGFDISMNSNEFSVVCSESSSVMGSRQITAYLRMDPACILKLSPGSAKDLAVFLSNSVRAYEKTYGKITTDSLISSKEQSDAK